MATWNDVRRKALALPVALVFATRVAAAQPELAITHVTVVDVRSGSVQTDKTLLIGGGKILSIQDGNRKAPANTKVVSGSGKFVIPGLWDMHYHFDGGKPGEREFNLLVANGVLGIRDMGDPPDAIFAARAKTASGVVLGPRIVACGPIVDGPNPSNPPLSVSVGDAAEARALVHELKGLGADCVKVHDGVPLDAYLALADEAKKAGIPVVGHVPVALLVRQASDAGQRSIEHELCHRAASTMEDAILESQKSNDVFAEAMRTKNFSLIPESIAKNGNDVLDHYSDERAGELYALLARNGTYLDPTLVTDRALSFVDELVKQDDPRSKYIPAEQRAWWDPAKGMLTRYRTPAYIAFRKRQFKKTLEQIPRAQRRGVRFLAGTDTTLPFVYPGFSLHDELGLFVLAGLSPLHALQTATINPAEFLGFEDSTGSVEAGKSADLVLLDANPLEDIRNTTRIHAIVLRGTLLRRRELDALLKAARTAAQH